MTGSMYFRDLYPELSLPGLPGQYTSIRKKENGFLRRSPTDRFPPSLWLPPALRFGGQVGGHSAGMTAKTVGYKSHTKSRSHMTVAVTLSSKGFRNFSSSLLCSIAIRCSSLVFFRPLPSGQHEHHGPRKGCKKASTHDQAAVRQRESYPDVLEIHQAVGPQ